MGAQENRTLVQRWVDAFNAFDLDATNALYAEDCEYVIAARGVHVRGRAAQRKLMEGFAAALPDRQMRVTSVVADDNFAVVEATYAGTSAGATGFPPAGERHEIDLCAVLRIADGQIVHERDYRDSPS